MGLNAHLNLPAVVCTRQTDQCNMPRTVKSRDPSRDSRREKKEDRKAESRLLRRSIVRSESAIYTVNFHRRRRRENVTFTPHWLFIVNFFLFFIVNLSLVIKDTYAYFYTDKILNFGARFRDVSVNGDRFVDSHIFRH